MRICTVSRKGLGLIYQTTKDFLDFLKNEEEREGKEKVCSAWQSLSEVEVAEYKERIQKIRRLINRIEEHIDSYQSG